MNYPKGMHQKVGTLTVSSPVTNASPNAGGGYMPASLQTVDRVGCLVQFK